MKLIDFRKKWKEKEIKNEFFWNCQMNYWTEFHLYIDIVWITYDLWKDCFLKQEDSKSEEIQGGITNKL